MVSIPVFFQAPLVRAFPWLSLAMTAFWVGLAYYLRQRQEPTTQLWGNLLFGFSLSWLCGSLYWGWLRTEPLWHIPVEALGLPIAVWAWKQWRVGSYFYVGSFIGTALTDVYIWATHLTPWWVRLMQDEQAPTMQAVVDGVMAQILTLSGITWAVAISGLLLAIGLWALRVNSLERWTLAGAVLNTLFVNVLFIASLMLVNLL